MYEIEEILSRTQDDKNVAKYASYNATDRYSDSPFSRPRRLAETKPRLGGKIDDISVCRRCENYMTLCREIICIVEVCKPNLLKLG